MRQDQRDQLKTGLMLFGAAGVATLGFGIAAAARVAGMFATRADFRGQRVLVTGGSRGLGLAIAEHFRRAGADVLILARDARELERARHHLEAFDGLGKVETIVCDVSEYEQVLSVFENIHARFGALDVLVNNAGIIQVGPLESQRHKDFEEAMNTNFWGVVNCSLAALPYMIDRRRGRIVNITSIGGKMAVPHLLPYTCSKFAAVGFSLGLRAETANKGITVTTVVPGLMRTGSFLNAEFKGNRKREMDWFSASSSLPGLTISADKAARQVVAATAHGTAEVILGAPAKLAASLSSVLPGLTSEILGVVNRGLPSSRNSAKEPGWKNQGIVSRSFITKMGRNAADRYNERVQAS